VLSALHISWFLFVGYLNEDGFLNLPRFEKYLTALAQVLTNLLFRLFTYLFMLLCSLYTVVADALSAFRPMMQDFQQCAMTAARH